jgi:hypothetical protein
MIVVGRRLWQRKVIAEEEGCCRGRLLLLLLEEEEVKGSMMPLIEQNEVVPNGEYVQYKC